MNSLCFRGFDQGKYSGANARYKESSFGSRCECLSEFVYVLCLSFDIYIINKVVN